MSDDKPIDDAEDPGQATAPFAQMAHLMANPAAGMAAASVFGFGMASHAFGMWMGAVAGASEASRRMMAEQAATAKAATPAEDPVVVKAAEVEDVATETAMRAPASQPKPASPDDLKAISGVGPKLEQVLNGFGIWSYGQIASLGDGEIAWLDDKLGFAGRIQRDGWVEQAKSLASALKSGSKGAGRKRS